MTTFNKLLLSVFLSSIFIGANAQTNVPQVINTNQTWTASGSPYIVSQNVLIKSGSTVKVMPGTKIRSTGDFRILIEGGFEARGTIDSVIVMDTMNFDFQKGSNGYNFTSNTGSVFSYCFFTGTAWGGSRTISLTETPLLVSNCRFNNTYYSIYDSKGKKVRIEKSIFQGKKFDYGYAYYPNGSDGEFEMDECIVKNLYGMYLTNTNTITRCLFYDWKAYTGLSIGQGVKKATFKCNTFRKFDNSIIEIMGFTNADIIIVSNTFDSAVNHIKYIVSSAFKGKFICKNNNFLYFSKYSVGIAGGSKLGYADTLVFTKNYWGTTTSSQIVKGIWDINDDIAVGGLVDFANYQTSMVNDCIEDESEEAFVGNSASVKQLNNLGFSIYPNPANNFINIYSNNQILKSWKIYNLTGELIITGDFSGNDNIIGVADLNTGFYLLEVSNGETLSGKQKLVINR